MNELQILASPLEQLGVAYRTTAIEVEAAIQSGRHKVVNRLYARLASLSKELRARGETGEQLVLTLLSDEILAVRVSAATSALPFAAERAQVVLALASEGPPSPLRLTAEMTLQEWRAGRLKFDNG